MHEQSCKGGTAVGLPVTITPDLHLVGNPEKPRFRGGKDDFACQEVADERLKVSSPHETAGHEVRLERARLHL